MAFAPFRISKSTLLNCCWQLLVKNFTFANENRGALKVEVAAEMWTIIPPAMPIATPAEPRERESAQQQENLAHGIRPFSNFENDSIELFAKLLRPIVQEHYEVLTNLPVGDAPREADLVLVQRRGSAPRYRGIWKWLTG